MGSPATIIFQGLGPEAAAARLSQATAAEALPSLAALQAGIHAMPGQSEAVAELDHLIDQYIDAVRYHKNTVRLRLLIEGKIRTLQPTIWAQANVRVAGSWRWRMLPKRRGSRPSKPDVSGPPQAPAASPQVVAKRVRIAAGYDPALEGLKSRASAMRRAGKNEIAAALYEQAAKKYIERMDFFTATHIYLLAAELYLEAEKYPEAIATASRAKYFLSRETEKDPKLLERVEGFLTRAREEAIASVNARETSGLIQFISDLFHQVATLHQRAGEKTLEAEAYFILSAYLIELKQYDQAYAIASLASNLFFDLGNFEQAGEALARMTKSLFEREANKKAALPLLDKAAIAFHRAGSVTREADMYDLKGDLLRMEGLYLLAAACYGRAERLYEKAKDREQGGAAAFNKVFALEKAGEEAKAYLAWVAMVRDARRRGDKKRQAQVYFFITNFFEKKGKLSSAVQFFTRAGKLFLEAEEIHYAVAAYGMASLALKKMGRSLEAARTWKETVRIVLSAGDKGGEAVVRLIIGKSLYDFERYEEARGMMERGLIGLRALEDTRLGEGYEVLAKILKELKLWGRMDEVLGLAYRAHVETRDREGIARVSETRRHLLSH